MSLIESVRTFIATYPELAEGASVLVDVLGKTPTEYSIVPLPGDPIIESYLDGSTLRQYPFAIQSMESTIDDARRMANSGFYEELSDWLETQNANGVLPTLGAGKTATEIEPIGLPFIQEFGESNTGIYQMQARLIYEQDAP